MKFESIKDIFEFNDAARERLLRTVEPLNEDQTRLLTDDGKWDVAQIVEHLGKVEGGIISISMRLLTAAKDQGKGFAGAQLSPHFIEKFEKVIAEEQKLVAPEVVQPKGGQPIADSVDVLNANRQQLNILRPMFEEFEGNEMTFPHPMFGGLTAIDWLALIGGHETRHTDQIIRILSKENAAEA